MMTCATVLELELPPLNPPLLALLPAAGTRLALQLMREKLSYDEE